jgi:hypothetical protein
MRGARDVVCGVLSGSCTGNRARHCPSACLIGAELVEWSALDIRAAERVGPAS